MLSIVPKNLINQRFDKLVVKQLETINSRGYLWKCLCDCGNIQYVNTSELISKVIHQCSRCAKIESGLSHRKNLAGKTIGLLTVLNPNEEITQQKYKYGDFHVWWNCQYKCGNIKAISSTNLIKNRVYSCGCLKSSGEYNLEQVLKEENISYQKEYSFPDLYGDSQHLRFDFAIFLNQQKLYLIECQGLQHSYVVDFWGGQEKFNKQKRYDFLKKEYCENHNIPLIIIPYKDYNLITKDYLNKKIKESG